MEALDRIHNCLELLDNDGLLVGNTLKEKYENTIGIYNLERNDLKMWEKCWNHDVMNLFQMEQQSGVSGIAALKPTSVDDLSILNSAIRLMAQKKGDEMPVNKLARFKANSKNWDIELSQYGLGQREKELLSPVLDISYGLCIAQEQFMQLVQIPELGGFNLTWADKLRKSIAKKNPAAYEELEKEYFNTIREKKLDYGLCNYVWSVLIAMSKGYGFNMSHTLAYSLIGLQELNLAHKFPIIYWNCACLITDAGGAENEATEDVNDDELFDEIENYSNEIEEFVEEDEEQVELSYEEEDCDGYPSEVYKLKDGKKKKKVKSTKYGEVATAIGKMVSSGIIVDPPNINKSTYTFSPDVDNNTIRYGLNGISKIGEEIIVNIINNRPYIDIQDFLSKVKVTKPQMVNLIKSGAFDEFGDRMTIMHNYIDIISDKKKRVTLQNMRMLIEFGLLPDELNFECKVYNFNKYIKKFKYDKYYILDDIAYTFYSNNFDIDNLVFEEQTMILQVRWDKIYQNYMDNVRKYIKPNQDKLLNDINGRLVDNMWNKYCQGSLSKWEMDSVSYYYHEHELTDVNLSDYGCVDYFSLPDEPIIDRRFYKDGHEIPLYKIVRIAGTVLDKDKTKCSLTLLTTSGVVTVKIFGSVFVEYDKQISEKQTDGKKKVMEKSWFSRGNKVIITGIRRDNTFVAKKYKNTPYHLVELIDDIDEYGNITIKSER